MSSKAFPTVIRAFLDSLGKHPDRTAVHVLERPEGTFALSYAELYGAGCRAAKGFAQRHAGPGDRVIVAIPTSRQFFSVYLGALFSGIIPIIVPAPRASRPADSHAEHWDAIARATGARVVVATADIRRQLTGLCSPEIVTAEELCNDGEIAGPDFAAKDTDIAHLQATSGTTGTPKFAIVRHRNLTANVKGIGLAIRHRAGDSLVTWLPFFHDMGLVGISYALFWQCPLIATDAMNFVHNPIIWLQMITRFGGTLSPAPNSAYQSCARLAKRRTFPDLDLSSWRVALSGAEPVHEETLQQFTEAFAPYGLRATTMLPVYGLAEATLAATIPEVNVLPRVEHVEAELVESAGRCMPAPSDSKRSSNIVSVGTAIPGHQVRVVDEEGLPRREREIGEIEFSGPSVIDGYWGQGQESEQMKRADGFLRTGDLGYLADGQLYITGRQKDIIIINGRNLVPSQIEAAMAGVMESDAAQGIVACGVQDARSKTESLHLIIESRILPRPDQAQTENELRNVLDAAFGLGGATIHWVKRGQIPKTSSGKLQRHRCRELISGGLAMTSPPRETMITGSVESSGSIGEPAGIDGGTTMEDAMETAHNLTVSSSKGRPNKRVLLTTPTWDGVIPFFQNRRRHKVNIPEITSKRDLLELCMNAEVQMDFEWPFGGIHILKENVPSIDILDYPTMEEYEARLQEGNYDVVALSFYRFNLPRVIKMAEMARNYGVQEVWGGNYGANSPGLDNVLDRVFDSDGVSQMKAIVEGQPLGVRRHPLLMNTMMRGVPVGYLYTGVGCRYLCKFCPTTTFMPDPFYTPIEEIRRVLDEYARNGIQSVTILDETFLQDREHSAQVIQEMHKRGMIWHCTSRVTLLNGRIKELHRMGMRSVYTGVESLANHTLKTYTKGQTVQSILNLFKELNDFGMNTTITYIFGFEFDTTESILEAIDVIKNDIKPFCLSVLVLTPHTNSQMEHIEPLIVDRDPTHYDSQHLVWKHPHLSPEDLYELVSLAHIETVHPRNIIKKRIVDRMKALAAGDPPLFSEGVNAVYREHRNRPGRPVPGPGHPDSPALA